MGAARAELGVARAAGAARAHRQHRARARGRARLLRRARGRARRRARPRVDSAQTRHRGGQLGRRDGAGRAAHRRLVLHRHRLRTRARGQAPGGDAPAGGGGPACEAGRSGGDRAHGGVQPRGLQPLRRRADRHGGRFERLTVRLPPTRRAGGAHRAACERGGRLPTLPPAPKRATAGRGSRTSRTSCSFTPTTAARSRASGCARTKDGRRRIPCTST